MPVTETVAGSTISIGYDGDLLPTSLGALTISRDATNGLVTGTTLGGTADTIGHNTFGELADYDARYGGVSVLHQVFGRDAIGRIETKTETVDGVTVVFTYSYDSVGRLWQVMEGGVLKATYLYDANGNRTSRATPDESEAASYDNQDRALTHGRWNFTYTAGGELKTKTDTTTGEVTTYVYDGMGSLRRVVLPDGRTIEEYPVSNRPPTTRGQRCSSIPTPFLMFLPRIQGVGIRPTSSGS